jgi:hypothetical protein
MKLENPKQCDMILIDQNGNEERCTKETNFFHDKIEKHICQDCAKSIASQIREKVAKEKAEKKARGPWGKKFF